MLADPAIMGCRQFVKLLLESSAGSFCWKAFIARLNLELWPSHNCRFYGDTFVSERFYITWSIFNFLTVNGLCRKDRLAPS